MQNTTPGRKSNTEADISGKESTGKNNEVVKNAEKNAKFIPLGHSDGVHYFYRMDSSHIIKATSFNTSQMLNIAPIEYWSKHFWGKYSVDWGRAQSSIIQPSIAAGPFDANRIRGTGVWQDKGRIVLNTGEFLWVDGIKTKQNLIKSYFIYIKTSKMFPDLRRDPLSSEEGRLLTQICERFNWQKPGDGKLLAGWLFIARIIGSLLVHPHIWITGGKGVGKSTLFRMINVLLGSENAKLFFQGASTEAGIRQSVKCNSIPVIFDEFEQEGKRSQFRIDAIIELFRSAWSATEGKVVKGSVSGESVEYSLNFCALVSSIRVRLQNDADRSRFSVLELMKHDSKPEKAIELNTMIDSVTSEWSERLFARSVSMINNLIKCQAIFSQTMAGRTSQRQGQQLGTLLAGSWCLENDEVVTPNEALAVCKDFIEFNEQEEDLTDEEECLAHLMTTAVLFRLPNDTSSQSIEYIIDTASDHPLEMNILKTNFGIKIKDNCLLIAHQNSELAKIYKETRWADNWSISLKRLNGATVKAGESFGSRKNKPRCVAIPLDVLH